jgi:hypothetical protein
MADDGKVDLGTLAETPAFFNGIPIGKATADPVAPMVFVKGGTTPSTYDNALAAKQADAEERRAHEDWVAHKVEHAHEEGAIARIGEQKFLTSESPRLVLYYMNRDGSVRQECLSEITMYPVPGSLIGEIDMMFTLVCPRCLERGVPQGESQLMVQNRHRKFHRDERKKTIVQLLTPFGPQIVHQDCTVTVDDIVRCSNFNCTWQVRIADSKVYEV